MVTHGEREIREDIRTEEIPVYHGEIERNDPLGRGSTVLVPAYYFAGEDIDVVRGEGEPPVSVGFRILLRRIDGSLEEAPVTGEPGGFGSRDAGALEEVVPQEAEEKDGNEDDKPFRQGSQAAQEKSRPTVREHHVKKCE
jgi:hypothetical protein